ncbi:MAG TPA: glycosyl hydrolase 53 family protein [Chthonomonadaceae bacterium]|nr:glycosyl hydrolase 53 family protein [Chthonomonadaceae bacterium]
MVFALCCLLPWLLSASPIPAGQEAKPAPAQKEFLAGGDISMLSKIEEQGGVFRKDNQPGDAIAIMQSYGCNCFRLRLFVNPNHHDGTINDLDYTVALAKRIKAAGARFLLDFHYSDTWADPGKQYKPAVWADLDFPALEKKVTEYTAQSIAAFKAQGALPDIVQVGNEITPGMLWPDGRLGGNGEKPTDAQWDHFVRLLKAAIRGVKQPLTKDDHVRIMIHIDRGADWQTTKWFFENLRKRHVAFDIIGQSYYPWWHGTLDQVRDNLRQTVQELGKDIVIVETAYPFRGDWSKAKNMAWPISIDGQKQFLTDLVAAVRATPDGHGLGVLWWFPEAIPIPGRYTWNGGSTALFDDKGNALPALEAFGSGR